MNKLNTSNYLFVMTSMKIKYNFLNNYFYKTIPSQIIIVSNLINQEQITQIKISKIPFSSTKKNICYTIKI